MSMMSILAKECAFVLQDGDGTNTRLWTSLRGAISSTHTHISISISIYISVIVYRLSCVPRHMASSVCEYDTTMCACYDDDDNNTITRQRARLKPYGICTADILQERIPWAIVLHTGCDLWKSSMPRLHMRWHRADYTEAVAYQWTNRTIHNRTGDECIYINVNRYIQYIYISIFDVVDDVTFDTPRICRKYMSYVHVNRSIDCRSIYIYIYIYR